jgi:hypothetical protein
LGLVMLAHIVFRRIVQCVFWSDFSFLFFLIECRYEQLFHCKKSSEDL